jgi:hypothetical protein
VKKEEDEDMASGDPDPKKDEDAEKASCEADPREVGFRPCHFRIRDRVTWILNPDPAPIQGHVRDRDGI